MTDTARLRTLTFTRDEVIALSLVIHTCVDEMAGKVDELDQDQRAFFRVMQRLGKAIPRVEC